MKKIIIIEDDSSLRELYKIVFKSANYDVDEEADSDSALNKLKTKKYDVILLDLLFTTSDGILTIKEIRKSDSINEKTPVIIITNLDHGELTKKALEEGADKILFKASHTPKEIYEEVNALLSGGNKI